MANTVRQVIASYDKEGVLVDSYKSISECKSEYGSTIPNIGRACKGIRKTAGGLYWRYIDDVDNPPKTISVPKKVFKGNPIVEVDKNGNILGIAIL